MTECRVGGCHNSDIKDLDDSDKAFFNSHFEGPKTPLSNKLCDNHFNEHINLARMHKKFKNCCNPFNKHSILAKYRKSVTKDFSEEYKIKVELKLCNGCYDDIRKGIEITNQNVKVPSDDLDSGESFPSVCSGSQEFNIESPVQPLPTFNKLLGNAFSKSI